MISIVCLVALILSTSSLSYFYWLQEQVHESTVFSQIESGTYQKDKNKHAIISFTIKDMGVLPDGYVWEEQGREFSYRGMFYDIVSIEKTKDGWMIKAASDEEEAIMVANKSKMESVGFLAHRKNTETNFKISFSKIVYHFHSKEFSFLLFHEPTPMFANYIFNTSHIYIGIASPPPRFIYT